MNDEFDLLGSTEEGAVDPNAAVIVAPSENEELRRTMTELAGSVKSFTDASRPKTEEPALTDEQKNELWAIYNPEKTRPDFLRKFFRLNPEATPDEIKEAKDLFSEMQQGFVKQAVVGARNIAQAEFAKMRAEFAPMQEYVSAQRAQQTKDRFYSSYATLDDPKYAKVIDATARLLSTQQFADEASYFKALAEGAADTIKGVLPDFDIGAKTATKPTVTTPRLPRTSVGGTGGSGGGGPAKGGAASDDDAGSITW